MKPTTYSFGLIRFSMKFKSNEFLITISVRFASLFFGIEIGDIGTLLLQIINKSSPGGFHV